MHTIHIIGGGTVFHVRPHLALSAPAYGKTARMLNDLFGMHPEVKEAMAEHPGILNLHLTRMAGGRYDFFIKRYLETNEDIGALVDDILEDLRPQIVIMSAALCDFDARFGPGLPIGKEHPRLKTSDGPRILGLQPAEKIIERVRRERKDIFLVGFKTTAGATTTEQFESGLTLLKKASCNLVVANDLHTRMNMIITPEQARYYETTERVEMLMGLVDMTLARSKGTFTRSTVAEGEPVPWSSPLVPASLRTVVNHCIQAGAYKPFLGSTVGHFAVKLQEGVFLTSRRKTNFNNLDSVGLVRVETRGDHEVIAYGSRPSVGGQSQRIIFHDHPDTDCIVHAHVPLKAGHEHIVPLRSQEEHECGSHQCGANTSAGLQLFSDGKGNRLYAVMLDRHGPNIVFHRDTDPSFVIRFIEEHFELKGSTSEGTVFKEPAVWHPSSP